MHRNRPATYCSLACRKNQVTATCAVCAKSFTRKASLAGPYCSRECSDQMSTGRPRNPARHVVRTCPGCAKSFTVPTYRAAKFCSARCRAESSRDAKDCPTCGTHFTFWKSWPRVYCSNVCAGKATVSNIAHHEPSSYETTCQECGTRFVTTPKRSRGRFCSRPCWAAWLGRNAPTGEDAPNWRGGSEPYYGGSWHLARRAVRMRDRTCVDCGVTPEQLGKSLDVHHLVPFREFGRERHAEANRLENLVGLCSICHQAREWEDGSPKRCAQAAQKAKAAERNQVV